MGSHSEKAASIQGAISAADTKAIVGVMRYAGSTTRVDVTLPTGPEKTAGQSTLAGRFLRIRPVGLNVQYAQGFGSAPALVYNQTAAFGTGNVAAGATVVDGTFEDFVVDARATHLSFVGSATAGFVEFYVTNHPGRP